jgi:hypothetical protein
MCDFAERARNVKAQPAADQFAGVSGGESANLSAPSPVSMT